MKMSLALPTPDSKPMNPPPLRGPLIAMLLGTGHRQIRYAE
jgi:hypothetical protein